LIVLLPLSLASAVERARVMGETPGKTIYFDFPGTSAEFEVPSQAEFIISQPSAADEIAEQLTHELFK